MTQWETVEVPEVEYDEPFYGWGDKGGQKMTVKVIEANPTGGRKLNGGTCPELKLELLEPSSSFNGKGKEFPHAAGTVVKLTASQLKLEAAIVAAKPRTGDMMEISMPTVERLPSGNTLKHFEVKIARSGSKPAVPAADEEDPPF